MNDKIKINLDSLQSRREWKRHKVKVGNNIVRILPPFGESSNGYPYRKWQIIWGLKDPQSGRSRPFASSMTSEKRCPVTEYVATLKKKAETLKSQLQASGASEETIKERLASLNKLVADLNPKTIYIYNAVDKAGEVGLLELKSTAHKKMKSQMVDYIQSYNQDPTSLNSDEDDSGVWFNVSRTGMGRDTEYDVNKVQKKIKDANGRLAFQDDRDALPAEVAADFNKLAYDLSSVYQIKTYDELQEILDANMSDLIDICADADLGNNAVVEVQKTTTTANLAQGKGKVNVRLDDEDDDILDQNVASTTSSALNSDDDFLAEADALLNS